MNKAKVIKELQAKHPGKNIVCLPEDKPTEIICELEPELGLALAVIDKSAPHQHLKMKEFYKVIKGELTVFLDGKEKKFKEGEHLEIKPPTVHYAVGDETWVDVFSDPAWDERDHLLVD